MVRIEKMHWQYLFQVVAGTVIILVGISDTERPSTLADKVLFGAIGLAVMGFGVLGIFKGALLR